MAGPTTIQGFDRQADARGEGRRRRPGEPGGRPGTSPGPEPILVLGNHGLTDTDPGVRRRRALTLPASVVLHAAAAVILVVVPLVLGDSLPQPSAGVHAFFTEPIAAPAPPPPPPAPRAAAVARVAPKAPAAAPAAFVAPIEVPTEIKPEEGLDLGVEDGVPGGVEGGVPGGVVGGIVGGMPDAPPPPLKPVRVGGAVRAPRKIRDVAPEYPPLAVQARIQGMVFIEATIDPSGRVVNATILRGVPMLNEAALAAVRQWVYTPTLLNGVPAPVIMTVTLRFQLN
jgi:protein TonB